MFETHIPKCQCDFSLEPYFSLTLRFQLHYVQHPALKDSVAEKADSQTMVKATYLMLLLSRLENCTTRVCRNSHYNVHVA